MGNTISGTGGYMGPKHYNYIIVGLPSAGKRTLLRNLDLGDPNTSSPISGLTISTLEFKNMTFRLWDIAGSDEVRNYWRQNYFKEAHGILFVVDASDVDRMSSARDELRRLVEDEYLRETPIVIFSNKQDLDNSLSSHEVADYLKVQEIQNRKWYIQAACALTGDGLNEGMEWISKVAY